MDMEESEQLAQAIIALIETHDGVRRAVMHCACCSPNIRTVI
jgi:hypothetical protein